jgi:hypothetical protein
MPRPRSLLHLFDTAPIVRASRFRVWGVRARGVPAILCGAAAIVFAAGAAAALRKAVAIVPETLREARLLLVALRSERREFLPLLALFSVASLAAALVPGAALADPSDIAFDQAQRIYIGGTPTPPDVGPFDAFTSTFEILGPSTEFPPLPGNLPTNASGGMLAAVARQREGVVYHYSFLGKLERVDDVAAGLATIGRPDTGEVDYLNLKTKTYATLRGDAALKLLAPSFGAQFKNVIPAQPAGGPTGTVTFTMSGSQVPLAGKTFDGAATTGLVYTTKLETAAHSDACPAVSVTGESTIYFDTTRDERIKLTDSGDPRELLRNLQSGRGCVATFSGDMPKRDPLFAHLYLYLRSRVSIAIPALPAPIELVTIIERGHLTPLTSADAALFTIPAGFTPDQTAPAAIPSPAVPPPAAPSPGPTK